MANDIIFICLLGKNGCGKTTIADKAMEELACRDVKSIRCIKMSFADAPKKILSRVLKYNLFDDETKRKHRTELIEFCEYTKEACETRYIWADILVGKLMKYMYDDCIDENNVKLAVIIDDLRFPEEYESLSEIGNVVLINVIASNADEFSDHDNIRTRLNLSNNVVIQDVANMIGHLEEAADYVADRIVNECVYND